MYDIKPLEEEWNKYHKKKQRPFFIGGILIIILFILIVFVSNYKDIVFLKFKDMNIEEKDKNKTILINGALTKLALKNNQVNVIKTDNPMEASDVLIEVDDQNNKVEKTEKPRKKVHLNIIQISSSNAYREVEKRFKNSHDIDDALFLAKNFYNKKQYKKAIYWSLEVNKLNENIEESWFIFVNSKVKTGHKNEAIRILSEYVKKSNSKDGKNLLRRLKK